MKVVAPDHLNLAYALLFWRIHSRPSFVNFMGEFLEARFDMWDDTFDAGKFILERMASALCPEGGDNMIADLNLNYIFKCTKPVDIAFKVHDILNFITKHKDIDLHLSLGMNVNKTYENLMNHLSSKPDQEPFFHTPKTVSKFVCFLAILFHRIVVGKRAGETPITIFDPNPGYGELTWALANVNKEMNIAYTFNTVGDDAVNLPKWCYKFLDKPLKEVNMLNPLDELGNKVDIIVTNPVHA